MKKGFTLLELIVVIIILGVLATLGMSQYFRVVEKSRSAEAKMVLGHIRDIAAGFYTDHQDLSVPVFDSAAAGIGAATNLVPDSCRNSHYFFYAVTAQAASGFTALATRCTGAGKNPQGPIAGTVQLVTDFAATVGEQDTWSYDSIYQ